MTTLASDSETTSSAAASAAAGRRSRSRYLELDRKRRARGERLERRLQAALGEHGGVQAAASSRSSVSASGQLVARMRDQLLRLRRRASIFAAARRSPSDERDQPLLGAVVEVALQAPALGLPGLDDPRPRGLQLGQARVQLVLQLAPLGLPPAPLGEGRARS